MRPFRVILKRDGALFAFEVYAWTANSAALIAKVHYAASLVGGR